MRHRTPTTHADVIRTFQLLTPRSLVRSTRRDDALNVGVESFMDVLDYRAEQMPDSIVFRMLGDDGAERGVLTFASLRRRARILANRLTHHAAAGDRVAVLVEPGLEYIIAYFGCLYAGVVAVPGYPPNARREDSRVARMLADCDARVALVSADMLRRMPPALRQLSSGVDVTWLDASVGDDESEPLRNATLRHATRRHHDGLAMLQYTSGSTAEPRGVMLTHQHLLHNARAIHQVTGYEPDDRAVFWLPPFHDMGLIGGILQPVYAQVPTVLMAPASFLRRPARWLEAMSKYRATMSGAPNFAYDLCLDRVTNAEAAEFDLSAWRVAFNGAEPVRADTMSRFLDKFAISGLRRTVFVPCYGLAEATLLVSGGPAGDRPRLYTGDHAGIPTGGPTGNVPSHSIDGVGPNTALLVSSGTPVADHTVVIVDVAAGAVCEPGVVGEIWVQGANVAVGYWNRPQQNEETFGATLPALKGRFLRTGDLGFLSEGRLFVTGRAKDLIILRGRNYYPQDIERAAEEAHADLRRGFCAAFSTNGGEPRRLVVVAGVARSHRPTEDRAVRDAMRRAIVEEVGVIPDEIVLTPLRSIPRTSSGKARRDECRRLWQEGQLQELLTAVAPTDASTAVAVSLRARLLKWLADELALPASSLDVTRPLRDVGIESVAVLRLQVEIELHLGRAIDPRVLWEAQTVDALVGQLLRDDARDAEHAAVRPVNGTTTDIAHWPEYEALRTRRALLTDAHGAEPFFWVHDSAAGAVTQLDGLTLTNFASYNYLGLSGHPAVNDAARDAVERWGTSVSASRLVSGERPIHRQLERALAEFLGVEDALTFVGGHATNVATISHLAGDGDVVYCDERLHNSGMQGAQFSGARRMVFPHNDWRALEDMLVRSRASFRRALVIIESVYSADGDVPDLAAFVEVKRRHDALLMVDEAHGLGVLGATGRGLPEACHISARAVDISMGTLSKTLASCGGYIAGSAPLVEYLRYTCPGFLYSVGMTPPSAAAAHAALDVLRREPSRVERLHTRSARFRGRLRGAVGETAADALLGRRTNGGDDVGLVMDTPVVPVIVGDSSRALALTWSLRESGIHVQPMIAPAVADHAARLRFFLCCDHSDAQIDDAVDVLVAQLKASGAL